MENSAQLTTSVSSTNSNEVNNNSNIINVAFESESKQQQQQQFKKLYFKPSTTEALHSAVLLKARNPSNNIITAQTGQKSDMNKQILYPKLTNVNSLLSISSAATQLSLNDLGNLDSNLDSSSSYKQSQLINDSNINQSNNLLYTDELDSPLKIKENILASIKNLKPVLVGLDPLRSSTSDDEDSHSENIERKSKSYKPNIELNTAKITIEDDSSQSSLSNISIISTKPATNSTNNNNNDIIILGSNTVNTKVLNKQPQPQQAQLPQRQIYFRANSTVSSSSTSSNINNNNNNNNNNKNNTKILGYLQNSSNLIKNMNNSTTANLTVIDNNSDLNSVKNRFNNSNNLMQINSNKISSSGKRGKEEALSNSSSSDEEDHQQLKSTNIMPNIDSNKNNSTFRLQLILNNNNNSNNNTINMDQSNRVNLKPNTVGNLLAANMNSSIVNTNIVTQAPYITPVVSSMAQTAAAMSNAHSNMSSIITNSPSASQSSNESEIMSSSPASISSASSVKSHKSSFDNEYESKCTNSSMSSASPTSCCSSLATNESAIDFNDDNSSTASGPIYIRQPGFEFHAQEVIKQQSSLNSNVYLNNKIEPNKSEKQNYTLTLSNGLASRINNSKQPKKAESFNNLLNNSKLQNEPIVKTNKAKKKLCMMNKESLVMHLVPSNSDANNSEQNDANNSGDGSTKNIQLKPIMNKAKREPLPMRLRALPLSFWQQPNQPNVSPGTMYLPPLFKNEIDSCDDTNVSFDDDVKLNSSELADNHLSSHQLPNYINNGNHSLYNNNHHKEIKISPANTDLLFKLFDNIENPQKDRKQSNLHELQSHYKRNSQKTVKAVSKALIKGEDPCIVDAVSEGLFPLLRLDSRNNATYHLLSYKTSESNNLVSNGLSSSTPVINSSNIPSTNDNLSFQNNTNNNTLPLLQVEQNYSKALLEVVAAL